MSDDKEELVLPGENVRPKGKIGIRHLVVFMGFLGFANVYAMRVNLSVAIVAMVKDSNSTHHPGNLTTPHPGNLTTTHHHHGNITTTHHHGKPTTTHHHPTSSTTMRKSTKSTTAKATTETTTTANLDNFIDSIFFSSTKGENGQFAWDEEEQGRILGMFFYGYVLTQLPGGRLAELFGAKWLFGGGILVTAVFTLLTPLAALQSLDDPASPPYLLYAVRIIEGLGEGVTFPAMLAFLARWAPPEERSRFTSFTYAGAAFGTVISMPLSGYLCSTFGWQWVFYVFGAIGVVWFVFWCIIAYDGPDVHPWIGAQEKAFIQSSLIECETGRPSKIPWAAIVTSPAVWAITTTHVTQNFGYYVLLTELPTYMKNILHFDMKSNAVLSGVPYLVMWLVALGGSFTIDKLIGNETLSTTTARKIANSIATMGPALALLGAAFSGFSKTLTVLLLVTAVGTNGIIYSGEQSAMLDIANNFAGTLMGIINALGNTMGFIAPTITGILIKGHDDLEHWRILFCVASVVYAVGNAVFVIFGTSKEQKWNRRQGSQYQ